MDDSRRPGSTEETLVPSLEEAAWPDMFEALQAAYAELSETQIELERRGDEIRQARDLLRRIVESMSEALFLLDASGRIARANPAAARLLGHEESGALLWKPLDGLVGSQDIPANPQQLLDVAPDGVVTGLETEVEREDGSRIPVDVSCTLVRDDRGKITGVLVVARDLTERLELERELQNHVEELSEADRRKDEYLATLAHELRNPLAPLRNWLSVLETSTTRPALEVKAIESMQRQVTKLARLVDELLDASRITRGKVTLRRERIDLRSVTREAIDSVRSTIEGRRHDLVVSLPDDVVSIDGDPLRLEQVIVNLLSNAAKYTDPGGTIWLELEYTGRTVMVKVRDTGRGLPPGLERQIFEPFVQGEQGRGGTEGGLGLGLSVVQHLVELHGGRITAHSGGAGRGSEFVVFLPTID